MKSIVLIFTLLLSGVSFGGDANFDWLIVPGNRVGQLEIAKCTLNEVKRVFGAANVKEHQVDVGEGEKQKGVVVYPHDKTKRMEILWKDAARTEVDRFIWSGDASHWRTRQGLTLGTPLDKIEHWNDKPFKMTGFGWDYAGTIVSWEDGLLHEPLNRDGRLIVRLDPSKGVKLSRREEHSVEGDKIFLSSNKTMKKINPRVYQLVLEIK